MRAPSRLLFIASALGLAAAACSSSDSGEAVAITATDTQCQVAQTDLQAGNRSFKVTNNGSKTTEVYVYGEGDRIVTEKENIGPGTSATFSANLAAGTYEIACKPGQTGSGIRQTITVTGSGGAVTKAADREVELKSVDYAFTGMDGFSAKVGETIEFEMLNDGSVEHEFEVLLPNGEALGEIGPTKPHKEGKVTLTFDKAGTYRFVCGIEDHEKRGMAGTFVVR
jgi:uncharacterized cupredoxin-like copper-binding protein